MNIFCEILINEKFQTKGNNKIIYICCKNKDILEKSFDKFKY
jgi:hypothetical protein